MNEGISDFTFAICDWGRAGHEVHVERGLWAASDCRGKSFIVPDTRFLSCRRDNGAMGNRIDGGFRLQVGDTAE